MQFIPVDDMVTLCLIATCFCDSTTKLFISYGCFRLQQSFVCKTACKSDVSSAISAGGKWSFGLEHTRMQCCANTQHCAFRCARCMVQNTKFRWPGRDAPSVHPLTPTKTNARSPVSLSKILQSGRVVLIITTQTFFKNHAK